MYVCKYQAVALELNFFRIISVTIVDMKRRPTGRGQSEISARNLRWAPSRLRPEARNYIDRSIS